MKEPIILQLEVGPMQNFTYLIACPETKLCAVVDPGWEAEKILGRIREANYFLESILLTHRHYDHVAALFEVLKQTKANVYVSEVPGKDLYSQLDLKGQPVKNVREGSEFKIGTLLVKTLHTPGHTPDSTCYLVAEKHLFTGDTLFQGTCGRCDLDGSNPQALLDSLKRLAGLNESIKVYPGHDYGKRPTSTIGEERRTNPRLHTKSASELL